MREFEIYYYVHGKEHKMYVSANGWWDAISKVRSMIYHESEVAIVLVKESE